METTQVNQYSRPKKIWVNIVFFAITTLGALIGCPLYVMHYGISAFEIALTVFFCIATGISITAGYHRLFSHATYKAHPLVKFFYVVFGSAAFEQSALEWSSQHRDHHRYVDTDRDPYDIKKGFWYAHIGWLMFWEHTVNYDNARDLEKDKLLVNQRKYYYLWAPICGIVLPVAIGAMAGHALGAFLFAVCFRITFVYHATFCINSVCHLWGGASYDADSTAKDNWINALVTYGEGYHNFHHRFPSDYRNGVRWYHFDPSKWLIAGLARLGLAWDLMEVSKFRIMAARLHSESVRVSRSLEALKKQQAEAAHAQEVWAQRYAAVKRHLTEWQKQFEHCQTLVRERVSESSKIAQENLKEARFRFQEAHIQWKEMVRQRPWDLHGVLLAAARVN